MRTRHLQSLSSWTATSILAATLAVGGFAVASGASSPTSATPAVNLSDATAPKAAATTIPTTNDGSMSTSGANPQTTNQSEGGYSTSQSGDDQNSTDQDTDEPTQSGTPTSDTKEGTSVETSSEPSDSDAN